ncbi:hypothetical protein HaLaN_26396 [Haematococcus lacustris]|uniref:Uncharacterized protein n=1 Tax=Haematococcus lacustris TaxID=44745 RepID=A0A6A0A635_HAELA|nr:hypothetical protein HaLaN_26396 [Haematococcus lacustris]
MRVRPRSPAEPAAWGHAPPIICIGINRAASRGGAKKDTLNNIEATGYVARPDLPALHAMAMASPWPWPPSHSFLVSY